MGVHLKIIDTMRRLNARNPHPLAGELGEDDAVLVRRYFNNYRAGDIEKPRGLRLRNEGLIIMKCFFKSWDLPLARDYRINSRHLLYLDRVCTMPWFLSPKQLTLFEPGLAMRAKLIGDLDILKDAFGDPPDHT